jgi:hypothetical protein
VVTTVASLVGYALESLPWLQYVEVEKLERAFNRRFDRFDVAVLASTHGNPVVGEDVVETYVYDHFLPAIEATRARYPVYV